MEIYFISVSLVLATEYDTPVTSSLRFLTANSYAHNVDLLNQCRFSCPFDLTFVTNCC